ncbi:MAG: cob(I)yrinic acid a,c-diamide adenosyltransferase [Eubacteriales bacterium]|nr:cob(I)yrinic acid a,c-diamide adenosyltransferase [Eubacteriales bacterium]
MEKSYVQVYTGNGKGKTTAAIGLAMRAAGRGLAVKIVQFLKGRDTGEMFMIEKIDNIELKRVSDCKKFFRDLSDQERSAMRQHVADILPVIESWLGSADLVILDESMAAVSVGILKLDELMHIINNRGGTEIVLTGRDAPAEIIGIADLVTEMRDVKHYLQDGVMARKGIEY